MHSLVAAELLEQVLTMVTGFPSPEDTLSLSLCSGPKSETLPTFFTPNKPNERFRAAPLLFTKEEAAKEQTETLLPSCVCRGSWIKQIFTFKNQTKRKLPLPSSSFLCTCQRTRRGPLFSFLSPEEINYLHLSSLLLHMIVQHEAKQKGRGPSSFIFTWWGTNKDGEILHFLLHPP